MPVAPGSQSAGSWTPPQGVLKEPGRRATHWFFVDTPPPRGCRETASGLISWADGWDSGRPPSQSSAQEIRPKAVSQKPRGGGMCRRKTHGWLCAQVPSALSGGGPTPSRLTPRGNGRDSGRPNVLAVALRNQPQRAATPLRGLLEKEPGPIATPNLPWDGGLSPQGVSHTVSPTVPNVAHRNLPWNTVVSPQGTMASGNITTPSQPSAQGLSLQEVVAGGRQPPEGCAAHCVLTP